MSAELIGATGLAGRYAKALFELAEDDKLLDRVAGDLGQLGHMIENSADLTRLIRSPVIGREDQGRAIAAVLKKAKMCELVCNFVGAVAGNRRLFALPLMIAAYQALLAKRRGEAAAEVVSSKALTKKQVDRIGDALKKAIGTKVAINAKVDDGLLGGLVIKVGSRMIDSSLRTKLQQLAFSMKGIG